jgi:hypothetical protein
MHVQHMSRKKHAVRALQGKPAVFASSPPASYFRNCLQRLYLHSFLRTSKLWSIFGAIQALP